MMGYTAKDLLDFNDPNDPTSDDNSTPTDKKPSYKQRQAQAEAAKNQQQAQSQSQQQQQSVGAKNSSNNSKPTSTFANRNVLWQTVGVLDELDTGTEVGFYSAMTGKAISTAGATPAELAGFYMGETLAAATMVMSGEAFVPMAAEAVGIATKAYSSLSQFWGKSATLTPEAAKIEKMIGMFQDYLGDGMTIEKPGPGGSDLILRSADMTKQIRFDILNSHGDDPHVNIETFARRNLYPRDQRFIEKENLHVYPQLNPIEENADDISDSFRTNRP